jgi:putative acetyltransferase
VNGSVRVEAGSPQLPHARALIAELDEYLIGLYPPETNYLLDVEALAAPEVSFFVAYLDNQAAGCAALRRLDRESGEVKRMYVRPGARGRGIGAILLEALERAARAQSLDALYLETGALQAEALGLFEGAGFVRCGVFGEYRDDPRSLFYKKTLTAGP